MSGMLSPLLKTSFLPVLVSVVAVGLTGCAGTGGGGSAVWQEGTAGSMGTPLPARSESEVPGGFAGPTVSRSNFEPIYFSLDSFNVPGSEQPKLTSAVTTLKNSQDRLIIAGFTDERGTEEYNRALGARRAQTVRDYLTTEGIASNRLDAVSFGEELPASTGDGESAWAKNRRVELGLVR